MKRLSILIFLAVFSLEASDTQKNDNTNSTSTSATPKGKIIFVTGSCSSGKSSMVKILAQKLNAKIFTFDEYVMPRVLKKFITKHYGRFLAFFISGLVMRNFFTTINFLSDKRKYAFQKMFLDDLGHGLADEPTSRMYREAKKVAFQGNNVIIESPIYLWGNINFLSSLTEFENTNITYVLAYCPWNDLVDRIKQRNSSKNKKIHRELDWVLGNFVHTFNASPHYHNHALEYLSGNDVHKVIAEYAKPGYKKKQLRLLAETQHAALQKFPKCVAYYVYPRFNYNIIVNTKRYNPEQGADVVLNRLTT
jgi:deoxyadenosine/deoxycytidine kinase